MSTTDLGKQLQYITPHSEFVIADPTEFPPAGPYRCEKYGEKLKWVAVSGAEWETLDPDHRARVYLEKALVYLWANKERYWLTARAASKDDLGQPIRELFPDVATVEELLCRAYHRFKRDQVPIEFSVTGVAELLAYIYGYPLLIGAGTRLAGMLLEAVGSQLCGEAKGSTGIPRIFP